MTGADSRNGDLVGNQVDQGSLHGSGDGAAWPVPTSVVGLAGVFVDPVWRISVCLSPVEVDLLRTEPLRRLHFVAHGGASTITTLQSYSRLEHTLGVLALVAHFRPEDELLRVAALLHDIGHLPLSHTCEGVSGLDHHAIGLRLLRTGPVHPVLEKHGISTGAVVADNVGPVSVVRRMACQLLGSTPLVPAQFARMTDPQLWSAFDSCAITRAESTMIRYEPHRLKVMAGCAPGDRSGWDFSLRKIYSSAPLVEGQRIEVSAPELAAELGVLGSLPAKFRVWWS